MDLTSGKICSTCGTQYPQQELSGTCVICADDRQYVPAGGQVWTDRSQLHDTFHVSWQELGPRLSDLRLSPRFAIGQRAILVRSPGGNVLWDCIPLLDEQTRIRIEALGGLRAIALSHPHFCSNMNEWAEAFNCEILIHASNSPWIVNRTPRLNLWQGDMLYLWDDLSLLKLGGHFPGSSVLYAPSLSAGGTVLLGDTLMVSPNGRHLSAMYSYPNRMPLPLQTVAAIFDRLDMLAYDTVHSYDRALSIYGNARQIAATSRERYGV
ncbi:MBL fold metallo-hydrolase [Pedobacter yulinensis]|uniref:MBL fold metallo-hydrolase n=1 Tax=Pedobacter yulinensis TaxID=2126353 RepID=A0A2T3HLU5_9SPHI|nr:MBL fold metallo-hydrolase [Pedobacter yulinensis]PST83396.1 MBL fold metallo-hydrolase [Pedobacter yulinensis]